MEPQDTVDVERNYSILEEFGAMANPLSLYVGMHVLFLSGNTDDADGLSIREGRVYSINASTAEIMTPDGSLYRVTRNRLAV
jgi:hypothetical protein